MTHEEEGLQSMRLKVSHLLALALVAALSVGMMADVAAAKSTRTHKVSAKQKAHMRTALRRQIKKNPAVIKRKSFLRKAALVNFKLPVTLRLRAAGNGVPQNNTSNGNYPLKDANGNLITNPPSCTTPPCLGANPNRANVDLGASLGNRTLGLGGSLSGEITFHDSFDGGALGNVSIDLKRVQSGSTHFLTSTSIPLLWNNQVTTGRFDANDLGIPDASGASGCADLTQGGAPGGNAQANSVVVSAPFTTLQGFTSALTNNYLSFGKGFTGVGNTNGLPGYPINGGPTTLGYIGIVSGLDDINNVKAGDIPGNDDVVGPSSNPFPTSPTYVAPSGNGFTQPPDVRNTVLRTNALKLNIANATDAVNLSGPGFNNAEGSQNIVIGKSGGEANLFGNIPGKQYGIDVTASFETKINSIIRVVDQDSFHTGLQSGGDWPAGVFNCRQVWTGYVNNYIPGVRLKGNLKIAPGLTYDGHLRIAKATVSSDVPARFAVAACLAPSANYAAGANNSDTAPGYKVPVPTTTNGLYPTAAGLAGATQGPVLDTSYLPLQENGKRQLTDPFVDAACDSTRTYLVQNSNYGGALNSPWNVGALTGGTVTDGYSTSTTGSKVSVAADLNVQNVSLDILIGDV